MDKHELRQVMAQADANPEDVERQIAAAWANDSHGSEEDAIGYYDAAWTLGVFGEKRRRFMVGYGSTLRNVGRTDESIDVHRLAITEYPGYAPNHAFLALALHGAGEDRAALNEVLTALIEAGGDKLDGYERALGHYRDSLLTDG